MRRSAQLHRRSYPTLIALALLACGPPQVKDDAQPSAERQRAMTHARADFSKGDLEEARPKLEALVRAPEKDALSEEARYYLARITLEDDPALGSRQLLGVAERLRPELAAEARLFGAIGASLAGDCQPAEAQIPARLSELEGAEAARAHLALARCGVEPLEHVRAALEGEGAEAHRAEAEVIVKGWGEDQIAAARAAGGPFEALLGPAEPNAEPSQAAPQGPPTLGVLLPLEGRRAPLGKSLKALAGVLGAPHAEGGPTLIFEDASDAKALPDTLRALADKEAFGVVGLFGRAQALAAAKAARELNLPLIMLTLEDRAVMGTGPVWRALHTPPLVARTAAGGGLERGGRVAAVIRPERRFAERLEAWFAEAWRGGGGRVIEGVSWNPAKPEWPKIAEQVKRLKADTLFIPCGAKDAAQLMSHLAAHKIWSRGLKPRFKDKETREVLVLGISEWYTPKLLQQARRYLEGVLIPTPFAIEVPRGARFADQIKRALSRSPTAFDALLHDSVKALTQAAMSPGEGAEARLRQIKSVEGGVTSGLDLSTPEALGGLYLLEVHKGHFIPMR